MSNIEILILFCVSLQKHKTEETLKWIWVCASSNTHEIDLSLMRDNLYTRKKFYLIGKFNAREKVFF